MLDLKNLFTGDAFAIICASLPWSSNFMLNWLTKSSFDISLLWKLNAQSFYF